VKYEEGEKLDKTFNNDLLEDKVEKINKDIQLVQRFKTYSK